MNENKKITRAAGVIGIATLASRILGLVRDIVIARFFGAGTVSDAFFVAFRIPNLLRRLFAEGTLSMAFVPVFTDYMAKGGKKEAFKMAGATVRMLSLILVVITLIGITIAPGLIRVIAPGFTGAQFTLTVTLTRIMFPYIIFICLVALCMGILNVLGHFAAPALAPVFLNLSIITGALLLAPHMRQPVYGLAAGVLIGGVIQLALQLPFLAQKGFFLKNNAGIWHPGIAKVGRLMGPAVFGAAVYQINILVGTMLASLLPKGSISYLYYADRLVQFPLGLFAISTSVAVLPSLARQATAGDKQGLSDTFTFSMDFILFITTPAMFGLILLREPIVALLFHGGAFDANSTRQTAYALLFYGVGLWAFSSVRIVVSFFYAIQDTVTPVKTATISIIANIVLGIALMGPLGHGGLALATSLASMLNFFLLAIELHSRIRGLKWKKIIESAARSVICSIAMGAFLFWLIKSHHVSGQGPFFVQALQLASAIFGGVLVYGVSAFIFHKKALFSVFSTFKRT
ncbi:MAG: murein biosynthesis integral membrane protein MurJ [Deltaproteobacteria bacterium]|nr:murein biosynthesis integral membrane protein MurJ [Deltaproteobacteria bacterium]